MSLIPNDYKRGYNDGYNAAIRDQNTIEELKNKFKLRPKSPQWPGVQDPSFLPKKVICSKCNIDFTGITNYYCSDINCPCQLKATC